MSDFDDYFPGEDADLDLNNNSVSCTEISSVATYIHIDSGGTGEDADAGFSVGSRSSASVELGNIDHGRNVIYRKFPPTYKLMKNGKSRRVSLKQPITIYSTAHSPGAAIRDAISGAVYKHMRVGTLSENLFFKVALATGELTPFSNHLYFASPEDYVSHMKCEVSENTQSRWTKKFEAELQRVDQIARNERNKRRSARDQNIMY